MTDPDKAAEGSADDSVRTPSISETFSDAARRSGLGQLKPGETPTAGALLGALGGVRGLVESVLPGFTFLLLFTFTRDLTISVLVPVVVAVAFVVARAVSRTVITPAIAGAIGIALTATLSLVTNRAENNFLPGIVINVAMLLVLLVSISVRWPLIGIFIGLIVGEGTEWRADRIKRRAFTIATWIWVIPSAIRVAIQVPLYLAERADLLAATKLLTGIPLYIAALWVTWLLVRAIYSKPEPTVAS
ncbi:MAG: hypothetical protein JWQ43_932 [Glaciihabitans sp.]|nr:hypothetical protein [Glaciihabitans sp.]